MKFSMHPLHDFDYVIETLRACPILCPYLLVICKKSASAVPVLDKALTELYKWNKVKVVCVDAGHDVHISNPEMVASIITEFLLESEAKL